MKKILVSLTFCLCLLTISDLFAQNKANTKPDATKTVDKKNVAPNTKEWSKISLDLSIGTRGGGLGVRYGFAKNWGVRAGLLYVPYIFYPTQLTLSGYKSDIKLGVEFFGYQLLADWRPAQNSRFKFIFGISYYSVAKITCHLGTSGTAMFGKIAIIADSVGTVDATFDWKGFSPFFGIGFGSPHPKHKVGCSVGMGVYYLSQPNVTVVGTHMLEGNYQNAPFLANNVEEYRYFPVFNFHINYRFKKP